jgi:acylphosphatase
MSDKARVHAIIKGTVQGIGFRWFVQKAARKFSLTGWVRNLSNGDVEVEAEGAKNNLDGFFHAVENEHPWASVNNMQKENIKPGNAGELDFEIRF